MADITILLLFNIVGISPIDSGNHSIDFLHTKNGFVKRTIPNRLVAAFIVKIAFAMESKILVAQL